MPPGNATLCRPTAHLIRLEFKLNRSGWLSHCPPFTFKELHQQKQATLEETCSCTASAAAALVNQQCCRPLASNPTNSLIPAD
eukprot:1149421-Pelagomonas_calceolata.AAC.7